MTDPKMPDEPQASQAASSPAPRSGSSNGLLMVAALMALGIALATWLLASRQIAGLRDELASLQAAHRELELQVTGGRGGAGSAAGQVLDLSGVPALGPDDAVVTLVEFSDYECPFCIRHFQQTMPQIRRNYINTGRIRYAFFDFPIDQNHPQAIRAHEAAHCALEQDRFWDLHPRLFTAPGTHTPLALEERAKEAHLDEAAFRACIASGRTTSGIRESTQLVESLGATGTPWFFVGLRDPKTDRFRVLKPIGGAQPYEQFAAALDSALKQVRAN